MRALARRLFLILMVRLVEQFSDLLRALVIPVGLASLLTVQTELSLLELHQSLTTRATC